MSSFLSRLHTDLRRARYTRRGATHLPKDVPLGQHKVYPRMQQIQLPEPNLGQTTLADALKNRTSGKSGNPDIPVSLQEMGTLLGLALGKRENVINRNYPSGGGLYPIETYLVSTALEDCVPGVFHYNPTLHTLERLWELPQNFDMKKLAKHPSWLQPSTMIIFTSVWKRSSAKYGDLSYLHAILEAGHMSENVVLVGCALDLSLSPYAGFSDTLAVQLLDLNENEEQPVHSVTICKKVPSEQN